MWKNWLIKGKIEWWKKSQDNDKIRRITKKPQDNEKKTHRTTKKSTLENGKKIVNGNNS